MQAPQPSPRIRPCNCNIRPCNMQWIWSMLIDVLMSSLSVTGKERKEKEEEEEERKREREREGIGFRLI